MLIAHYIGDHADDSLLERLGVMLTRLAQKGPHSDVTHTEAIHEIHADGSVTMASSSLRDGGVRSKTVRLNPLHWLITDVPQWDVQQSIDLLAATQGWPYDSRGAWALFLPGSQSSLAYFCNKWVATPYLRASGTFSPSQFCAICMSIGSDVTRQFFSHQPPKEAP